MFFDFPDPIHSPVIPNPFTQEEAVHGPHDGIDPLDGNGGRCHWENLGKYGKTWEIYGKIMGKLWENIGTSGISKLKS